MWSQEGLRKHHYEQSWWRWWNSSWAISNPKRWCSESAALNMPDNLENTAVATRLEKVGFHPNHIHKSINIIHHINKLKDKSHIVISIDAEKAFDKIQHLFMIKALQKAGREGTLPIIQARTLDHPVSHWFWKAPSFPLPPCLSADWPSPLFRWRNCLFLQGSACDVSLDSSQWKQELCVCFSPPSSSRNLLHASQLIVGAQDLLMGQRLFANFQICQEC